MYNRYLSSDKEPYVPVYEQTGSTDKGSSLQSRGGSGQSPPAGPTHNSPGDGNFGSSPVDRIQQLLGFGGKRELGDGTPLRRLLARFHLEDVDTGDLLLLILLFFLLEEKADDELLIALGILLIL